MHVSRVLTLPQVLDVVCVFNKWLARKLGASFLGTVSCLLLPDQKVIARHLFTCLFVSLNVCILREIHSWCVSALRISSPAKTDLSPGMIPYIAGTRSFCVCFYVDARTWISPATHEEISKLIK